jgi:hypothetical protein
MEWVYEWIGFHDTGDILIFHGKIDGFPVKMFPTKPIHW